MRAVLPPPFSAHDPVSHGMIVVDWGEHAELETGNSHVESHGGTEALLEREELAAFQEHERRFQEYMDEKDREADNAARAGLDFSTGPPCSAGYTEATFPRDNIAWGRWRQSLSPGMLYNFAIMPQEALRPVKPTRGGLMVSCGGVGSSSDVNMGWGVGTLRPPPAETLVESYEEEAHQAPTDIQKKNPSMRDQVKPESSECEFVSGQLSNCKSGVMPQKILIQ